MERIRSLVLALIVILPLVGGLLAFILNQRLRDAWVLALPCTLMILCAGLTFITASTLVLDHTVLLMPWATLVPSSTLLCWSVSSDSITLAMLGLVTGVSAMVHLYAWGYMHDDLRRVTFMGLLSLFTFFMMILVTSNHWAQFFVGWEGVGLASYLLIGFWFDKPQASQAAFKAFLVNRIADLGLLTGICLIYARTGSLFFHDLFATVPSWPTDDTTLIAFCLIGGMMGKSAQFGFHVWLPDAMEGPTPVSALIHAATMVTAGVFMIVRLAPFFEHAPLALDFMVLLGGITAVWGGLLAYGQNDIKRTIAYSTCSHLGLMVLACGASAYGAGLFHVLTHGLAKAMLFLGAGCVIHAFGGEQNMSRMGGCAHLMPITYAFMVLGCLHLMGCPGLGGHHSKEAILLSLWLHKPYTWVHQTGLVMALGAVLMTGFYSKRLILRVFHGPAQAPRPALIHEAPRMMWGPIAILGLCSLIFPTVWHDLFSTIPLPHQNHLGFIRYIPLMVTLSGAGTAYIIHHFESLHRMPLPFQNFQRYAQQGFGVDALYDRWIVQPFQRIGHILAHTVDEGIHAGGPVTIARYAQLFGQYVSRTQAGVLHDDILIMALGLVVLIIMMMVM